jgi:hypothetical protein
VVGRFRPLRLLPGRYWAVALPGSGTLSTFDREALENLHASATSVTLTAGDTASVQLRIVLRSRASGVGLGAAF